MSPKLVRMIASFHEDQQGAVQYDGSSSDPFLIKSRVKQGFACTRSRTLRHLFLSTAVLHLQPVRCVNPHLFNLARLQAKARVPNLMIYLFIYFIDIIQSEMPEQPMRPKAEWAINSEAMRAREIIVLVKSNQLVKNIETKQLQLAKHDSAAIVLVSKPALFATSGL